MYVMEKVFHWPGSLLPVWCKPTSHSKWFCVFNSALTSWWPAFIINKFFLLEKKWYFCKLHRSTNVCRKRNLVVIFKSNLAIAKVNQRLFSALEHRHFLKISVHYILFRPFVLNIYLLLILTHGILAWVGETSTATYVIIESGFLPWFSYSVVPFVIC